MNYITYSLYNKKTINNWLIVGAFEKNVAFEPMTMSGDINSWLSKGFSIHENPCRKEFVEKRRKSVPNMPCIQKNVLGESIVEENQVKTWELYFPWENPNVELSHFWFTPTYLKSYALNYIECEEEHIGEFDLVTCGGATVWINDELIVDFTPYTRNLPQEITFSTLLKKGLNKVFVCFDDLAERDTQYYFRIDYKSDNNISVKVPIGERNSHDIKQVEDALNDGYFLRDTAIEGDIYINIANPFEHSLNCRINIYAGEILDTGKKDTISYIWEARASSMYLGNVENTAMGFLCVLIKVEVEGIEVPRVFKLQVYPEKMIYNKEDSIETRKATALKFIACNGQEDMHKAIAILNTGGDIKTAEKIILDQIKNINRRQDCSDFYLVTLYRIWIEYRNSSIFTEEFWKKVKDCILDFRYWIDEPGDDVMWFFSENHALLFHTCELIAGQIFPEEIFTNSGLMGREHVEKAEGLLIEWFEKFFEEGLTEWNSSAYIPIDVLGLASLYAMANSAKMKDLAKRGLDLVFYDTAVHGYKGMLSCSFGRSYEKELKANYTNGASALGWIAWGEGYLNPTTLGTVSLCLCDYQPPQEYKQYLDIQTNKALVYQKTQGYQNHVNVYTYKTKDFLLSSACEFKPGEAGYQEHVVHVVFDATAMLWINHPGEMHKHGGGRPNYWAGNGCLPKVCQHLGLAVVTYNIPNKYEIGYTHAYVPIDEFDEIVQKKEWLFIRKGKGFAGIYAKQKFQFETIGPTKDRELISEGYKNVWVLRCGNEDEFISFSNFIDSIIKSDLSISESLEVDFLDPIYGKISSSWEGSFKVNNNPVEYKGISTCQEVLLGNHYKKE